MSCNWIVGHLTWLMANTYLQLQNFVYTVSLFLGHIISADTISKIWKNYNGKHSGDNDTCKYTVVNRVLRMQKKKNFNSDLTVDWIHHNSLSHISYVRLDHTLYRIHFQENEINTTACGIHHSAHCALSC